MSNDDSKNQEPRTNQSFLWYAAAVVLAIVLIAYMVMTQNTQRIAYSEFLDLIEANTRNAAGELADGKSGQIEVTGENDLVQVLKNLRDVKIAEREVRGIVDIETKTKSDKSSTQEEVTIAASFNGGDTVANQLHAILRGSNVKFEEVPPSWFDRFGFVLILTLLLFGFFFYLMRRLSGRGFTNAIWTKSWPTLRGRRPWRLIQRCRGNR